MQQIMDRFRMLEDENGNTRRRLNNVSQDLPNAWPDNREAFWDDVIDRTTNIPGVLDVDEFDHHYNTTNYLGVLDVNDFNHQTTNISGVLNVEDSNRTRIIPGVLNVDYSDHTTNIPGVLNVDDSDHTTNIPGVLNVDDSDHTTNIPGVLNVDDSDHTTNISGVLNVDDSDHATNIPGVLGIDDSDRRITNIPGVLNLYDFDHTTNIPDVLDVDDFDHTSNIPGVLGVDDFDRCTTNSPGMLDIGDRRVLGEDGFDLTSENSHELDPDYLIPLRHNDVFSLYNPASPSVGSMSGYCDVNDRTSGLFNSAVPDSVNENSSTPAEASTATISAALDEDDIDSISPSVESFLDYGDANLRAYGLFDSAVVDRVSKSNSTPIQQADNFFDKLFENLEEHDHTTEAEPCQAVATKLYPHQKQALNWMIGKENKITLPPFWEQRDGYYFNTLTNEMRTTVNSVNGGILADDMGLGKTLQIIALILTNFEGGRPLAYPVSNSADQEVTFADTKKIKQNKKSKKQETLLSYISSSAPTSTSDSVLERSILKQTSSSQLSGQQHSSIDLEGSKRSLKRKSLTEDKNVEEEHSSAKYGRLEVITDDADDTPMPFFNPLPESQSCQGRLEVITDDADDTPMPFFNPLPQSQSCQAKKFDWDSKDTSNSASDGIIEISDGESVIMISDSEEEMDTHSKPVISKNIADDEVNSQVKPIAIEKITGEKCVGAIRKYLQKLFKPSQPQENESIEHQIDDCRPESHKDDCPIESQKDYCAGSVESQVDDYPAESQVDDCPAESQKDDFPAESQVDDCPAESQVDDCPAESQVDDCPAESQVDDCPAESQVDDCPADSRNDERQDYDSLTGRCKTTGPRGTLIICPTSVLSNWEEQFRQHMHQTVHLFIYVHYGKFRTTETEYLKQQDVVITTYHTIIADFKKADKGPIYNTEWLRIVLDEGHNIRNPKTAMAKIIFELKAQRRWVLTGTPIQNSLEDLWSILNFLRVEPLTDKKCWNRTIAYPVASKDESAMQRVFHLMRNLALRRTKTQQVNGKPLLELPARNVVLKKLTLSQEQREAYDLMENEGKILIRGYIENNTVRNHLFEIYVAQLRLRQFCCHPKLVYKAVVSNQVAVPSSDNEMCLNADVDLTQESVICSVCFNSPKNAVIASNGCIYCWACIQGNPGPYPENTMFPEQKLNVFDIKKLKEQLDDASKSEEDCIICTNILQAGVITPKGHMYCRICFEKNPATTLAYESISQAERKNLLGKLLMWLYEQDEYSECPICYAKSMEIGYQKAVITFCGHQFCCTCIDRLCVNEDHPPCPICRKQLDRNKLIRIPLKLVEGTNLDEWSSSAKLDALMTALSDLHEKDPSIKSIVISQFTSLLDLIEKALSEKDISFTRLDGTMSQSRRLDAMKRFSENSQDSPSVFLLSLKAGGVGINLTAASQVFLMEPYWNPAAEEQCFDRCHRLGQTRDVEITKFVIENSVEENMLKLQEKKRQLMNGAFLRKLTKEQRRVNYIKDLIEFFQID
ncbi:hypothetical protein BsWGS_02381 [Bradybaena similaris]